MQGDLSGPPCPAAADGLVCLQVACGTAAQEGLRARLAEEQQARAALEAEAPKLRSHAQAAQQDRAELEQDLVDLQRQARQVGLQLSPLSPAEHHQCLLGVQQAGPSLPDCCIRATFAPRQAGCTRREGNACQRAGSTTAS